MSSSSTGDGGDLLDLRDVAAGIRHQAEHCRRNGAPATGSICEAALPLLEGDSLCGQRMRNWPGRVLEDAMPLRFAGGLHHLKLCGADDRLVPVYDGSVTDQRSIDALVAGIVAEHDAALLPWFDGPPQTNEAGRSASFMAGLLWLTAQGLPPLFEMYELGASAGINTMMDRYFYDLGGTVAGPANSAMRIVPEWRGPPPPPGELRIASIRGCDVQPLDLSDPAVALRVASYVWPENRERMKRMQVAIAMAAEAPPRLDAADGADWVGEWLAEPQAQGTTRIVHHSIVWQYIPEDRQARIRASLEAAGSRATAERPLVWMMLETNRRTFRHELSVRRWPGPADAVLLGQAQAHGAWVEWSGS